MEIVNQQTGEVFLTDNEGFLSSSSTSQRYQRFLLLSVLRSFTISKSVRFCHVSSLSSSKKAHLSPSSVTSTSAKSVRSFVNDEPFSTVKSENFYNGGSSAYVFRGLENHKAHFGGLLKCSNVWSCPVCSSRIIAKRVSILEDLNRQHLERKGFLYLLTLTIPHKKSSDLSTLVNDLTSSYRVLQQRKKYKDFKQFLIGTVRGFETTYSDVNGFHPHFHIVLYTRRKFSLSYLQDFYYSLWSDVLRRKKYLLNDKNRDYLVDVRDGKEAFKYVSKTGKKWTISDEVARGNSKKSSSLGGRKSYTPQSILIEYAKSFLSDSPNDKLRFLFNEYEKAFHGKNMLSISRSLFEEYELRKVSDEVLNNEFDEKSELLASLSADEWKMIYKHNLFSDLLTVAENAGSDGIVKFLRSASVLIGHDFKFTDQFHSYFSNPDKSSSPLVNPKIVELRQKPKQSSPILDDLLEDRKRSRIRSALQSLKNYK